MRSLIELVRKRLRGESGGYLRLAKSSGLGYRWIVSFANGKIKDPGLTRLGTLAYWLDIHISGK